MTIEKNEQTDTLDQLSSVLNRLEGRIDSMEKGEMPPFMEDKKESKDDKKDDKDNGDNGDNGDDMEKSQYSDVISSEYLSWLEDTVKSNGVDTAAARAHFDQTNKAQLGGYDTGSPGSDAGQAPGRTTTEGKPEVPKANFGTGVKGKASTMNKGQFLNPSNVSPTDMEAAYQVYKAARIEQEMKSNLGDIYNERFQKEAQVEKAEADKRAFDARGPLDDIQKAISDLSTRIDGLTTGESGVTLQKSVDVSNVEIPSTEQLATMEWSDVHSLANSVWRGE